MPSESVSESELERDDVHVGIYVSTLTVRSSARVSSHYVLERIGLGVHGDLTVSHRNSRSRCHDVECDSYK